MTMSVHIGFKLILRVIFESKTAQGIYFRIIKKIFEALEKLIVQNNP